MEGIGKSEAVFAYEMTDCEMVRCLRRFRKTLFVDELGWDLNIVDGEERDQFDTDWALHCALRENGEVVGGFRFTPTTVPYLSREIFPQLASTRPFPVRADYAEVSRLGVIGDGQQRFDRATQIYGLMLHAARMQQMNALVAVADLIYERFLRRIGIATRRYGHPQIVGTDRNGRDLRAVAGEIPISDQPAETMARLFSSLQNVEINDDAFLLGRQRLSA